MSSSGTGFERPRSLTGSRPSDKNSTIAPQEDPRHLLTGLIENAQVAPAIKSIYDRNWIDTYQQDLESSIATREHEIATLSRNHSEDILSRVDSMLSFRQDLAKLQKMITTLNNTVQQTGRELVEVSEELVETRLIRLNIGIAMHVIRASMDVFSDRKSVV